MDNEETARELRASLPKGSGGDWDFGRNLSAASV
jgi:hypothetical protein